MQGHFLEGQHVKLRHHALVVGREAVPLVVVVLHCPVAEQPASLAVSLFVMCKQVVYVDFSSHH